MKAGESASLKATAFAAITCIKGPPCIPGKINLSTALAYSALHITTPPRGPRRVLWVVVVTKHAYGTGFGWIAAAIRPAIWAISTNKYAPTDLAICWNRG